MRFAGPTRRRRVRAVLLAPEGRLACDATWLKARSPDHAWTLTVCRRPMPFAMPGSGGDAPGWIVLRDAEDAIRGVVHLDMMQRLAEVGPAGGTLWQAVMGLVPSDLMSARC